MKLYKKIHKKKIKYSYKYISDLSKFANFDYLIISKKIGFLSKKELEATRKILNRKLRKFFLILILKSPTIAISKKSMGSRMGKGVGSRKGFCLSVFKGSILFNVFLKKKIYLDNTNPYNLYFSKNLLSRLSCPFYIKKIISLELLESKRLNIFISNYSITAANVIS